MRRILLAIPLIGLLLVVTACSRRSEEAQVNQGREATVLLRDGSTVAGAVVDSTSKEIKVTSPDKVTHAIPMDQVRSIEYADAAPAAGGAPVSNMTPSNAPSQTANLPSQTPPAGSMPAQRQSRSTQTTTALPPVSSTPPLAAPVTPAPSSAGSASREAPAVRPERIPNPTEAAITTRSYELPAGSEISVRVEDTIDSAKAAANQMFPATVTEDARDSDGNVVIPRGANAQITIRSASQGGNIRGASDLLLDLQSVSVGGRRYALSTTDLEQRGKAGIGANKRTATYTGGGAAIGAVIGAIAGGGKGAAIGAASGAGAGALTQILTKGSSIKVPVESILTFRLDQPLRVVAR